MDRMKATSVVRRAKMVSLYRFIPQSIVSTSSTSYALVDEEAERAISDVVFFYHVGRRLADAFVDRRRKTCRCGDCVFCLETEATLNGSRRIFIVDVVEEIRKVDWSSFVRSLVDDWSLNETRLSRLTSDGGLNDEKAFLFEEVLNAFLRPSTLIHHSNAELLARIQDVERAGFRRRANARI